MHGTLLRMQKSANADIGQDIKKLRLAAGMTIAQLAERSGVSVRTVLNIESGATNSRIDVILKVLDALAEHSGDISLSRRRAVVQPLPPGTDPVDPSAVAKCLMCLHTFRTAEEYLAHPCANSNRERVA